MKIRRNCPPCPYQILISYTLPTERKLLYSGTHASEDWKFLEDTPERLAKLADWCAKSIPPPERKVVMSPCIQIFRWEHILLSVDGRLGTCSAYNDVLTLMVKLSVRPGSTQCYNVEEGKH